ncbi:dienelactone hydrolase family protein [Nocardioides aequoreus]|uniref:dienelactone hydrolase family protein n=1 Tax=Nocardioides aequoreus TaxID=397278 RepID=UPI0004C3B7B9|nr:dienelactone hydrolase family protein [Nocardioides aequoreus]
MPSTPTVAVPTDAGDMPAHVWLPESGSGPGILLLQEIFGISRYVEQRAQDLADLGYVVLAPEVFWRLGVARVPEGPDALDRAMGLLQQVDWDAAVGDVSAALDVLRGRDEVRGRTGVVGFCFGGGLAFNLAAVRDPDCLVSYYGSALPGLLGLAPQVTAPSLHHFGLDDSFIPPETVAEIQRAVERDEVDFHLYDGADHAFDNPDMPQLHDPGASALAWERTAGFLGRRLPVG